jgi:hypothetical protein
MRNQPNDPPDVRSFRTAGSPTRTPDPAPRSLHHIVSAMTAPFGRLVGRSSRKEEAAMIIEATGDPIENRCLVRQHRDRQSRHTMLQKSVTVLAVSAVLGVSAIASNAALAFGPPPLPGLAGPPPALGGPPPGLGALPHPGLGAPPHLGSGGPPQAGPGRPGGLSDLRGSAGLRDGGRGIQGDLHGRGLGVGSSYGRSAGSNYGRDGWRNRYYGVSVYGDNGSAYADDGCTYTYSYRRHTRVTACTTNE